MNEKVEIRINKDAEKIMYLVAGCNGAGKSTAFRKILDEGLNHPLFVNADDIAKLINPDDVQGAAIEAGRKTLIQISKYLNQEVSFCLETTLATLSYVNLVKKAHALGYKVALFYYWLDSPDLAVYRVAERVREGGHDIPEDAIRRRYSKSINYLMTKYIPIVDYWRIMDNSSFLPREIACGAVNIYDDHIFTKLKKYEQ